MKIKKNHFNRYEIPHVVDPGVGEKKIKGVNGYHGFFANIIGRILEIFRKTVGIKVENGTFYLGCEDLVRWFNRVENQPDWEGRVTKIIDGDEFRELGLLGPNPKALEEKSHDRKWVKETLEKIAAVNEDRFNRELEKKKQKAIDKGDLKEARRLGIKEDDLKDMLNDMLKQNLGSDVGKCREIIEEGADVNPKGNKISPLGWVCNINIVRNNEEKVLATCELLLEKGADINMRDYVQAFPLEEAVKSKSLKLVSFFINNGADVNMKTDKNKTLIEVAEEYGCSEEIKNKLREGNVQHIVEKTPQEREEANKKNEEQLKTRDQLNRDMENAARNRNFEECKKLVEQGADNKIYLKRLNDDLWSAATMGKKEKCEELINLGAEVNPTVISTYNPLMGVVFSESLENKISMCEFLLEKGADVNARDPSSNGIPIEAAIQKKNTQLIELFIRHGADLNLKTSREESLDQFASLNHLSQEIINKLKNKPAG